MKDMVSLELLNVNTFRKTIIRKEGWTTVGYARKSKTGDTAKTRQRLIQEMINALHTKTLCSNAYVSVNCNSSSPLSTRDAKPTLASEDIQKKLRRINGDFQGKKVSVLGAEESNLISNIDLVVFLQTAQTKVRLVVQDFAGLTTNTVDLTAFIK
jgi:DNA invertase Pin-like site-specific DNA recombinase